MSVTTTRGSRSKHKVPLGPAPTLGPLVCRWIERNLVHADGDYFGKPFRLRRWQRGFIWRAYELLADGSRRYSRALLGLGKGNGKTELAAALAIAELAGPVTFDGWRASGVPRGARRLAPDIPVAAASFEQADILFGAAATMIREGRLAPFFSVLDTEIVPTNAPGRAYRVAAAAGTNDGRRPTFFLADELHEWLGNKERVHLVLSNGRAKRTDAWELNISTAGWDSTSLLGRMYEHGKRAVAGEVEDPRLLFVWHEPEGEVDLADAVQLEAAIRAANPAVGDFLPMENVKARIKEIPEHEARRYCLNQWSHSPERWIPGEAWSACREARDVPDGAPIYLGFDGSYARDATAIVGCTEDGFLFVVNLWEKPLGAGDDWRVDIMAVEDALREACGRWEVKRIGCDPYRWQRSLQLLQDEGLPVVEWPSHSVKRMAPASAQFEDAVASRFAKQDGNPDLARHIANCIAKIDARGRRPTKDHKDSPRHIDLAVAAVIAYDLHTKGVETSTAWKVI